MKNKRTKIYAIILIIISVLTMVFTPLTAFAIKSKILKSKSKRLFAFVNKNSRGS